jgi:thiol-disulfide isomerase/thioredoxin
MSTTSRARQRRARQTRASSGPNFWPYAIIGAGVVALFALAILLTRSDDGGGGSTSTVEHRETAPVTIEGEALPAFEDSQDDPAVGSDFPAISGQDFTGRPVRIADDGTPKMVMFLAHWCAHCQAEVPVVQEWLDAGSAHDAVDVVSVVTATDETQPNYPPSEWLQREGWTAPVILDDATYSAGAAAGVTSYPFFVFVDGDGKVAARAAGELPIETIEAAIDAIH